jgi:hypothetical protein
MSSPSTLPILDEEVATRTVIWRGQISRASERDVAAHDVGRVKTKKVRAITAVVFHDSPFFP